MWFSNHCCTVANESNVHYAVLLIFRDKTVLSTWQILIKPLPLYICDCFCVRGMCVSLVKCVCVCACVRILVCKLQEKENLIDFQLPHLITTSRYSSLTVDKRTFFYQRRPNGPSEVLRPERRPPRGTRGPLNWPLNFVRLSDTIFIRTL